MAAQGADGAPIDGCKQPRPFSETGKGCLWEENGHNVLCYGRAGQLRMRFWRSLQSDVM